MDDELIEKKSFIIWHIKVIYYLFFLQNGNKVYINTPDFMI